MVALVSLIQMVIVMEARAEWMDLCPGVEYAQFAACAKSPKGDSKITIVRIVPTKAQLRVLSHVDLGLPRPLRANEWADQLDLAVVINAGMYATDMRHVGYLKIGPGRVNSQVVRKDYKSVLVFDPSKEGQREAAIVDLDNASIAELSAKYGVVVQNLRMIRSPGTVVWGRSSRQWSEAAFGMDRSGRMLFIFCRSPYTMFEFSQCLLELPLDLVAVQHLEGGGAAALAIRTPRLRQVLFGGYETTREGRETDQGDVGSALPIVLAIPACH
jgi:uncharacterized protein YigE (DUF2233 family)